MASERFANVLPFAGVKDGHDAVIVALHTFMIEAGFRCVGIGEEIPDNVSSCSTDALPQGWNSSPDVYALQYKQSTSFQKRYLLKALRLDTRLAIHVLDVDKQSSVDLTIDTLVYVKGDNNELLHNLYDYPRVVKELPKLEQLFKSDVIDKITRSKEESSSRPKNKQEPQSVRPRPNREDPLRVLPRHPSNSRDWPPVHDPFGFGDADRLPGHPGSGGMLMDPFHQRRRGPENNFGHPSLPRGAVPPEAHFYPFGPDAEMGGNRWPGRPGPDHLRPPGFEDDFM